jgi:hypothetical protein
VTDALGARLAALEATVAAHVAAVDNPHAVTKDQVGLGNVPNTKMNLAATTNPSPFDGSAVGYSAGSVWINDATGGVFILVDASVGSAQWREVTNDSQQLICDGDPGIKANVMLGNSSDLFVSRITIDTTVYVPSLCFSAVLSIEDGLFLGQRRTVTTAGPGDIAGSLLLDPITQPGGQGRLIPSGDTVIWEWGAAGWVVVFDTTAP